MTRKAPRKQACFLPASLRPHGINELVRLGSDHAGGHVVSIEAVASTRSLLSIGLGNCDFEWDMNAMGRIARLDCYDADADPEAMHRQYRLWRLMFLSRSPKRREFLAFYRQYRTLFDPGNGRFAHHRKAIGRDEGKIGLDAAIAALSPEPGSLFLKVAADGDEYDFLDQIIEANALLSGLVIEFHAVGEHLREIEVFVAAMTEFMAVDNTTVDNGAKLDDAGIPNTIEITMSARDAALARIPLAGATSNYLALNTPSDPAQPDFEIVYMEKPDDGRNG